MKMHAFVIAKKNTEFLDTPVFHAGDEGKQEAIVVFTSPEKAAKYIEEAGWTDDHEVGELRAIQLLRWIVNASDQGTEFVVVNPDRSEHMAGRPQTVYSLDDPMKMFSELLDTEIIDEVENRAE
jgi:hypothetical protein